MNAKNMQLSSRLGVDDTCLKLPPLSSFQPQTHYSHDTSALSAQGRLSLDPPQTAPLCSFRPILWTLITVLKAEVYRSLTQNFLLDI
jgi:hypothetical protein